MADNLQSLTIKVNTLNDTLALLLGNSVQPKDGTSSTEYTDDTLIPIQNVGENVTFIKRADFLTAVLGSVRQISDDPNIDETTDIGQVAIGTRTGINRGELFIGVINFFPPTQDSHINKIYYKL